MDSTNPLAIAYGHFRPAERIKLSVAAQEARLELRFAEDPATLTALLDAEPVATVMDSSSPTVEDAFQLARAHPAGKRIPMIAVAEELDDLVFAQTFSAGGDDAVELSQLRPLLARLRLARGLQRLPDPEPRGLAVVADADVERRKLRARTLYGAGFAVQFASTAAEALQQMQSKTPKLLLLEGDLEGGSEALLESAKVHSAAIHVLLSRPQSLLAATQSLEGHVNAAALDAYAPAESIIFLVNELQGPRLANRRKTRRVLYGTKVAFRGEGREQGDYGFNYNLSAEGLYVRTLAPPEDEHVWLELRPPRSNRWVHLEGRVVWRRPFGQIATATVPPGFGVQLLEVTPRNLTTWLDGYAGILDGMGKKPMGEPPDGAKSDA